MKTNKLVVLLLLLAVVSAAAQENTIEKIIIHGNYNTPDSEILSMIPVSIGDKITREQVAEIESDLRDSGAFESVEVALRYTSFDTNGPAALIIKVVEHTSFSDSLLILPMIGSFEGYGFSYGLRVTSVDFLGFNERISVPATWGGTKQIGLEVNLDGSVPFADVFNAGLIYMVRDEHQVFDEQDERLRFTSEIGWNLTDDLYVLGSYRFEDITYAETIETSLNTTSASLVFDTRKNLFYPYNAIYANYTFSYLFYEQQFENTFTNDFDVRLYKRLFGQTVMAAQFKSQITDTQQPIFDRNFLGGDFFVRGFKEPDIVGDNYYYGSLELRVPMSEVSTESGWGWVLFYDYGAIWNVGQQLDDATVYQGAGLGTFIDLAGITLMFEYAFRIDDDQILMEDDGKSGEFHFRTFFKF